MMQSKKVTVAHNDVISTHCYMFSVYQVPVQLPAAAPPPLLQRCNRHSHHCGIDSPSLLLSTTSVASAAIVVALRHPVSIATSLQQPSVGHKLVHGQ